MPLPLRAALDLLVLRSSNRNGPPRGRAAGDDRLVAALRDYGWVDDAGGPLIALGAPAEEIERQVVATAPPLAIVLADGRLAGLARPLLADRNGAMPPPVRLSAWDKLGYEPAWVAGLFGPGAVGWALADRVLRKLGRPDLADRCRLGMLRSLVASRAGRALSLATLVAYRRAAS
jgi:hypothetical protein